MLALLLRQNTQKLLGEQDTLTKLVKTGGYCLSFGWNTNGVGKKRGFEIIEILIVAHGGSKNDTLCTVERKIQRS